MRKLGELEKQHSDAVGPERDQQISGTERKGVMNTQKGRQDDEPKRESGAQKKLKKAIKREKREQKTKERKEREAAKAKKKKEGEDKLRRRGEMLTRNQPKIAEWFGKEGAGSKRLPREWGKEGSNHEGAGADETEEASQRGPKVKDMSTRHGRRDTAVGGRDHKSD